MAHVADPPSSSELAGHVTPAGETAVQHPPVSPGKVAMWLFLATEIMFFTGLIGSYIVLRAGTPPTAFSNLFPPATNLERASKDAKGLVLTSPGGDHERVVEILEKSLVFDRMQKHDLDEKLAAIERRKLDQAETAKLKEEVTREYRREQAEHLAHATPAGVLFGVPPGQAKALHDELVSAGAEAAIVPLATFNWPLPYDFLTNPLSIDLTAIN